MQDQFLIFYANVVQAIRDFGVGLFRPTYYASAGEAGLTAAIGLALLIGGLIVSRRGLMTPDHEAAWTTRRLQFTGVFGTVFLVLGFLRYEGIPYLSMTAVLGAVLVWAVASVVQLALYRQLVVQPARAKWRERKAHEQYLPKPKRAAR